MKKLKYNRAGLTFVELLVALMVCSIIFAAVATLAFAMGNAQRDSDEQSTHQAQLRYATLRITELLRYSKYTVLAGDDLAIWRADDNLDGKIDPSEIVYIEAGAGRNHIYILDFPDAAGEVLLAALKDGSAKTSLIASYDERRVEVLPQCSNVVFEPATIDENTSFVGIGFDLDEAGATRHYEISAYLRCRD
ncbi:MAG: prepilin-type N-terminal cleavage/methylation domain-containing protein [Phycisphaerae bacterium]|jgi:type II secretory pathway pseudopilin PulG